MLHLDVNKTKHLTSPCSRNFHHLEPQFRNCVTSKLTTFRGNTFSTPPRFSLLGNAKLCAKGSARQLKSSNIIVLQQYSTGQAQLLVFHSQRTTRQSYCASYAGTIGRGKLNLLSTICPCSPLSPRRHDLDFSLRWLYFHDVSRVMIPRCHDCHQPGCPDEHDDACFRESRKSLRDVRGCPTSSRAVLSMLRLTRVVRHIRPLPLRLPFPQFFSSHTAVKMPPKSNDKYTDPKLREEVKEDIKASDKGGEPGQWSARKVDPTTSPNTKSPTNQDRHK
jgi:hypothetical protein